MSQPSTKEHVHEPPDFEQETTTRSNAQPSTKENVHEPLDLEQETTRNSIDTESSAAVTDDADDDDEDDDDDYDSSCERDFDGHRPSLYEIRSTSSTRPKSRNQSRAASIATSNGGGGIVTSATATLRRRSLARTTSSSRPESIILSRIRSRPSASYQFTHPLSHIKTTKNELVDFDGEDDPYRPMNWPLSKKIATTLLYGLVTMTATWASSCYSAGTAQVAEQFGVDVQVATLGTSLFLIGFGLGPLLWAPLSEVYGRRLAVLVPMFVATCFSFGSATAKDFQTLMLTRFFGAFFASAPVTNTGGVLGDLFSPAERGIAMAGYAMAVVGGPVIGPIVSAAVVVQPGLGWRWTEYLAGLLQAFVLVIAVVFIDESYPPQLLVYKARRLRIQTGNWALHTEFEEWDVSVGELAKKFLLRPVQLLCTPICFLVALYASFCYGILYMQLGAIPFIFHEVRGWSLFVATLPFLCIFVGASLGAAINIYNQTRYNEAYHAAGNRAVPEQRLPPMMLGSILFASGQFVTGWTASPTIHWVVPCIGLLVLGTGFFTIFQAALNYLVDTFTRYAASAVAANTFLRSCFACAFPLVVTPLYRNVGVGPGSSITGGFATLLIPVPFVFYTYGKRIRARSKWSKGSVFD
ncbi:major facilitator superfamily domain-containing protein [Podospora didyma]|uniref:Major facilitator superfamily domain-containing protein n=1 Tax=Podospora didyma TaxID=330526 RepID=A0AAE0NQY7_9PEZI|nr:major facilitator superfamily domain-containing protein [Podospora didyma]